MLKKAGTLWILDEPFCSVDQNTPNRKWTQIVIQKRESAH